MALTATAALAVVVGASAPPEPGADPAALMDALEAEIRALPAPSPATLRERTDALRAALEQLQARVDDAEQTAAAAYARMASYTGAMLSREQKKVMTSRRLVEITRKTGRTTEVERYQARHQMLLDTIDRISRHYGKMVEELSRMDPARVEAGFRAYETYLIEEGLAEQILVQQAVEKHVRECRASGEPAIEVWKEELGSK